MGVILARVKLTCPKTNEEVDLIKDCMKCSSYKHWGEQGDRIVVTCEMQPKQPKPGRTQLKRTG